MNIPDMPDTSERGAGRPAAEQGDSDYWKSAPRHGGQIVSQHLRLHGNILRELGHSLEEMKTILDFGCGAGEMVNEYRKHGYEAFGCDIQLEGENEFLRLIETPYRVPFADNTFDFVFSGQVLEHVQDHAAAFSEIRRVLKPGGVSLHIFPSKLAPIENHVFVPLAGVLQNIRWLTFWAALGIREQSQRGKGFKEVARENFAYLRDHTKYLSGREIVTAASAHFDQVTFVEGYMIKHSYGKARYVYPLVRAVPFLASLYSTFYSRVILLQKGG